MYLGYAAAIFMGLSLGLLGAGGSIMTVPILVYLFSINPIVATGYSLFTVGATALVGALIYFKRGEVDLKTGINFAMPSFFGVITARTFILPNLPDPVFYIFEQAVSKAILVMLVFSLLMLAASYNMIKGAQFKPKNKKKLNLKNLILILLIGFITGIITGFVGAGGGFLIIPVLVMFVGLPMKTAVGTSLSIIATNSLIGFIGDLQFQQNTDWTLIVSLALIAITGLFVGISLSKRFSDTNLKKSFGFFILLMGLFILIDQILRIN
jgi:uncharacterized membrane protein YfcA